MAALLIAPPEANVPAMSRPSRMLLIAVLVVAGVAAALVAAEAAYRWHVRGSLRPVRYYRNARIGRTLVRNVDYGDRIHINGLGLRGPDVPIEKEPGTTRVLAIGPSTTFDPCARRDAETWTSRLEYWLEAAAPDRAFQVLNAGVSGMPLPDHLTRLQTELFRLEPDVVILYAGHGIVSAEDARVPDLDAHRPDAVPTRPSWDVWLRERSRLYDRLRPRWTREARTRPLSDADWRRAIDNGAARFSRDLTSMALVARSLGAEVVFVEINRVTGERAPETFTPEERATWVHHFGSPPEVIHEGYVRFDSIWQAVADSVGATFVPADQLDVTGTANYCANDPIHFSTAGADLMARRLAERLLAAGVS